MISPKGQLADLISKAQKIVVLQADNPDADSLGSALALEQILGEMGKEASLYCGVDIPSYLRYLPGWDRVIKDLPRQFDLSLIVDTSAVSLFETLKASEQWPWLASKPCVIIDHHDIDPTITFASVKLIEPAVATAEVIYDLAKTLGWPLNDDARTCLGAAIMSDSLGLTSEATSPKSIRTVAELAEQGLSLAKLEASRRELMRKSVDILRYKGQLLQRVEFSGDSRIATITIPWEEIERYSPEYNPSMLVIDELRWVEGVDVAIAFKLYPGGKITGKIRCNYGRAIARDLAEHFGGGGHPYASGFKIENGRPFDEVKQECISRAADLLNGLKKQ